jgi:hypothetical protein
VSLAKSPSSRLMKVQPAELDLERLKPYLKQIFAEDAALRWQSAAELNSASVEFRDKVSFAIICLLTGSIAASHRARPADRNKIKKLLSLERKAVRLIGTAYRLYGTGEESVPPELERALIASKRRKAKQENAAAQLKQLRQGRAKYRAFAKFICLVGEAYETASNEAAIVKFNNAADERCSGPFGELLEAAQADADKIWKMAGFKVSLDGPHGRNARLDYARKVMMRVRRGASQSRSG